MQFITENYTERLKLLIKNLDKPLSIIHQKKNNANIHKVSIRESYEVSTSGLIKNTVEIHRCWGMNSKIKNNMSS